MIKVIVAGAAGRMGREVLKSVWNSDDMQLIGAVDVRSEGQDIGFLMGIRETGIMLQDNLEHSILDCRPDVMVDFTVPQSAFANTRIALHNGVRPVIGTTGLSSNEIDEIIEVSGSKKVGGVIAPNFAIGALLMIKFASQAARFFPHVEIVELHHDQKLDAPSGTAFKTAEAILKQRNGFMQGVPAEEEKLPGARGGQFDGGIRLHSIRLPGLVAHQEVIFGSLGQTLTIRHDSISRESFMPGVLTAIRKVMTLEEVVYGLDNLIFE